MRRRARSSRELAKSDTSQLDALGFKTVRAVHLHGGRRQDDALRTDQRSRRTSIRRRSDPTLVQRLRRSRVGQQRADRELRGAERDGRVRLPRREPRRRARRPGMGTRDARLDLPEARHHRDGRHGRGHQGALDAGRTSTRTASASTARRTAATRRRSLILRHPDVVRGGVGLVAGDRLVPLRHDLHRAVHVDSAGEQGRLRGRQRDELREEPARAGCCSTTARPTTTCTRTTRCSSSRRCSSAGKSFEVQVGPDAGHTRRQQPAHDGVLHREPGHASRSG